MPVPSASVLDLTGARSPEVAAVRTSAAEPSGPLALEQGATAATAALTGASSGATAQTVVSSPDSSPAPPARENWTVSSSQSSSVLPQLSAIFRGLPLSAVASARRLWSGLPSDGPQREPTRREIEESGPDEAAWDTRGEKYSGIRTLAILVFGLLPLLWEIQLLFPSLAGLLEMKTWVYVHHSLNENALRESIVLPLPTSDVSFAIQRASRLREREAEERQENRKTAEAQAKSRRAGAATRRLQQTGGNPGIARQHDRPWADMHAQRPAKTSEEQPGAAAAFPLLLFPRSSGESSLYEQLRAWHSMQKEKEALEKKATADAPLGVEETAFSGKDIQASQVATPPIDYTPQSASQPQYSPSEASPFLFLLSVGAPLCASCRSLVFPMCSPASTRGPGLPALPSQAWASSGTPLESQTVAGNSEKRSPSFRSGSSQYPPAPPKGPSIASLRSGSAYDLAVLPSSTLPSQHLGEEPSYPLGQRVGADVAAGRKDPGLSESLTSADPLVKRLHTGLLAVQSVAFYLHDFAYSPSVSSRAESSVSITPPFQAFSAIPPCYDSPSREVFFFKVDAANFNVTPPLLLIYASLVVIMIRWLLLAIRSAGEALLLRSDLDSEGNLFSLATVSKPLRIVGAFSVWSLAFCLLPYGLAANEGCMRGTLQNTDIPIPLFYAYFQYSIWFALILAVGSLRLSAHFKRRAAEVPAEQSLRNVDQALSSPLVLQGVAALQAAPGVSPHAVPDAELRSRAGVSAAAADLEDLNRQSEEETSHPLSSVEVHALTEVRVQESLAEDGPAPGTHVRSALGGERRGGHERPRSRSVSLVPGMNLHARRQVVVGGTVPRGSASREFSQGMLLRMGYRLCVHRLRRRARVVWEALDWRREQILASRYHLYHEICSAGAFFFFIHTVSGALVVLLGQGQPWMKAVWLHILCMFLEAWTRHQIAKAEERVQRTRRAEAPAAPANRGSPSLSRRWLQRGGGSWEYALVDEPQDRYLLKQMSSTYFSIAGQFLVDKVTSSSVAASFCRSCLSASSDHVHESSPSAPPPRADVLGPIRTGGSSADGGAFFSRAPLMPADTPLLGVTARESGEGLQDSVHELSPPNGAGSSSGSCTLESQGSASACGTGLPRFSRVHTNTDRGSLDLEGESAARGEASCSTSLPDKPLLIPGIASGTERRMSADVLSPGGLQTTDHETATGYGALRNEVSRQSRSRGRYADVERETFGPLSPEGEPRGGNVDCHSCWTGANSGREALGSSEAAVSVEEVDTHEGKRSRDLHCERHDSKALHNCRSPGEVGREEVQNETAQRRTGGEGGGGEASYENTGRDHSDTGVPDGKEWDSIQLHAHCGTYRSSCPSHLSTLSTSTFSSANTVCSPSSFSECSSSSTSSPPLSSPVHSSSPGTTVTCFKTETEHAVCELCAEADPDAVLLPCGHGGVCEACARLIVEKEHQRARSSGGLRALLGRDTSPASGFAGSLPGQATSLRTPTSASSRQRGDSRFFPLQLPRCPFCRQAVQRVVKLDAACQTQSGCISAYTALVIMDEQGERRRNWKFNSGRR